MSSTFDTFLCKVRFDTENTCLTFGTAAAIITVSNTYKGVQITMAKKKEKTYFVKQTELVKGQPVSKDVYNNITLPDIDTWLKTNAPEYKDKWLSILNEEQPVKKIKVEQTDADGNVVMRTVKHRDGTTSEVAEMMEVPAPEGYKRMWNAFEVRDWFLTEFGMMPVKATPKVKVKKGLGNW